MTEAHMGTVIGGIVATRWVTYEGPKRKYLKGLLGFLPSVPDPLPKPVAEFDYSAGVIRDFLPIGRSIRMVQRKQRLPVYGPKLPPVLDDVGLDGHDVAAVAAVVAEAEDVPQHSISWARVYASHLFR